MSQVDFREYHAAFMAQNDTLYHHGILGMKWGVRRYQNPDGSLTPAGVARYHYDDKSGKYKRRPKSATKRIEKQHEMLDPDTFNALYGNPTDEQKKQRKQRENVIWQEGNKLLKDGWRRNEKSDYRLSKKEGNTEIDMYPNRNSGSYQESKQTYDLFKKDKEAHINAVKDQFIKAVKDDLSHWTDNPDKVKKELQDGHYWLTIDGNAIDIMSDAIEELGYHSLSGEYDVKTKKLIFRGLEG